MEKVMGNLMRLGIVFAVLLLATVINGNAPPGAAAATVADGFNYPVGPRNPGAVTESNDGDGWYNAQDFAEFNADFGGLHSGEDWNDERGGASDIGAPVYAVANGRVVAIRDLGTVGEAIALEHTLTDGTAVYSVYIHIDVGSGLLIGSDVTRDQSVGTIGDITASGLSPHLHFELRTIAVDPNDLYKNDLGNGYYASQADLEADGFTIDPSDFIDVHRPSGQTSIDCLATVLMSEASIGTHEERVGVAWVVFNRVNSSSFPDTICGVVNQPGQFATNQAPTPEITDLASALIADPGFDPVGGSTHFFSPISMPKEGEPTGGFDVRGGLHTVPGIPQRVYFPSWTNTLTWVGNLPNVRQTHYMFFTPFNSLDVFLLVDLSGSFGDDLPLFKAQAPNMISTLKTGNPNTKFGLGSYEDYPISPFGSASFGDVAYRRDIDLTFNTPAVGSVINGLFTRSGGDGPQSQLPALFQAASGAGQDLSGAGFPGASIPSGQQANFRDGATKIFLLWTDATFHQPGDPGAIPYPGPSFSQVVDAILALDPPMVFGISSGGGGQSDLQQIARETGAIAPAGGVDCNGDGTIDILEGEPLVCSITSSGVGIGEAIVSLIEVAPEVPPTNQTPTVDVGPDHEILSGDTVVKNITFNDPAGGDSIWDYTINWDDGTVVSDSTDDQSVPIVASHQYFEPGEYTVEVCITDEHGATGCDSQVVTVQAVFLLIDEDSIDDGAEAIVEVADSMGLDSAQMVNSDIADLGVRQPLGIPVGTIIGTAEVTGSGTTNPFMTGQVGDEGWFALKTIPDNWDTVGPTNVGLRNFVLAGPGLGTGNDPEALLDKIPDVTPLRTAGLEMLVGRWICGLVYDSDISINYDPLNGSLKGANLGLIAFEVLAVGAPDGSVLPDVTIQIRDTEEMCHGPMGLFMDASAPNSSSEPSP